MGQYNREEDVTAEDAVMFGREVKKYNHPAFGLIRKSVYTGSRVAFGSPIVSNDFISISVTKATHVCGSGSESYDPASEVFSAILTKAQWADFISTNNSGVGTPCTLRHVCDGDLVGIPEISNPRYNSQDYHQMVKDTAQKSTERLNQLNQQLIDEINGKASKTRLREIQREINIELSNLPSNIAYTVQVAEEAMTDVANEIAISAKSKIENYAQDRGLDQVAVAELNQITFNPSKKRDISLEKKYPL